MDYREHLIRPLSRYFVDQLVQEIFFNPTDNDIIYRLIYDSDKKVAWRAAWACQKISEKHSGWFTANQFREISNLAISTSHEGLQRGCLSILLNLPLPDPIPVELINACFDWIISPKLPVSVQALSLKILYRICCMESGFKPELIATLENVDFCAYSVGFNTTRKNILKLLINK